MGSQLVSNCFGFWCNIALELATLALEFASF